MSHNRRLQRRSSGHLIVQVKNQVDFAVKLNRQEGAGARHQLLT